MRRPTTRKSIIAAAIVAAAVLAVGGVYEMTGSATTSRDTKAFTACMRSHNLPDFPEVTVSSEGLVNFNLNGERVDVRSEKYGAAVKACESLLPAGARLPGAPSAPSAPTAP